jgi:hypothetical protein
VRARLKDYAPANKVWFVVFSAYVSPDAMHVQRNGLPGEALCRLILFRARDLYLEKLALHPLPLPDPYNPQRVSLRLNYLA